MISVEEKLDVRTSNVGKVTHAKIKTCAKIFKMMASGIYSNKIRAVVREYATNCRDSHIAAGKLSTPFKVKLPNLLDPTFTLRDYGKGLTDDEVRGVYNTLFESDKDKSNEFTGQFGVGAFAAYAYTDSFQLRIFKDGICTNYTLYTNEEGIPDCAQLGEIETDEPDGAEVIIPVLREDFNKFAEEASFLYSFFDPPPIVTGNNLYKLFDLSVGGIRGNNWVVFNENLSIFKESKLLAVMGSVVYPVNISSLHMGGWHGYGAYDFLFENSVCIMYFDIGDLSITVSRESIEYTPTTINIFKTRLDEIKSKYEELLKNQINELPTYWDACDFYWNEQSFRYHNPEWKNKRLTQYVNNPFPNNNTDRVLLRFNYSKTDYSFGPIRVTKHAHFYIDDLNGQGAISRLREQYGSNYTNVYLLKDPNKRQILQDALGCAPGFIKNVSTLPKPAKKQKAAQKITGYLLQESRAYYSYGQIKRYWSSSSSIDTTKNPTWVEFDSYYIVHQGDQIRPYDFKRKMEGLPDYVSIDPEYIWGIPKSRAKLATKLKIPSFFETLTREIGAEITPNMGEYAQYAEYLNLTGSNSTIDFLETLDELLKYCSASLLKKLKEINQKCKQNQQNSSFVKTYNTNQSFKLIQITPSRVLQKLLDEIDIKYPLLRHIDFSRTDKLRDKNVGQYISTL